MASIEQPPAKRLALRFSLRALLIGVTVFAIWMGFTLDAARKQRAAVARVKELGGKVGYDYQWDPVKRAAVTNGESPLPNWLLNLAGVDFFHNVVQVDLGTGQVTVPLNPQLFPDESKSYLPQLPKLKALLLFNAECTDECLQLASKLKDLENLMMWDATLVTDAGVANLQHLPRLRYIHLSNAQLTDESLRTFGSMTQLEGLSLQGNRFTDQGLAYLQKLERLETLWVDLGPSQITDIGLAYLHSLKSLKELGIQKMQVTPEGISELKSAVPSLKSIVQ